MVKVVKVKMVIFIFGFGHLLTIYKYKYLSIVADFDNQKTILTKWPNDQNDHMFCPLKKNWKKTPQHSKPAILMLYLCTVIDDHSAIAGCGSISLSFKGQAYFGKKDALLRERSPFSSGKQKRALRVAIKKQRWNISRRPRRGWRSKGSWLQFMNKPIPLSQQADSSPNKSGEQPRGQFSKLLPV